MQPVLISCVPKLNDSQQRGLLNLITDIERQRRKVYLWSDNDYALLSKYQTKNALALFKLTPNPARFWYAIKARLLTDKAKWVTRYKFWAGTDSHKQANRQIINYIKEASAIFAAVNPEYFICWNPYCCRFGAAYDAAKVLGLKTRAIEWGYLPGTFLLDNNGTLAASTLFNTNPLANYSTENMQVLREQGRNIFEGLKAGTLSQYKQEKAEIPSDFSSTDKSLTRILVLGIDEVDSGAYPADHFERRGLLPFHRSSYQQAHHIARINENYRVIFKPHPSHNKFGINNRVKPNMAIVNGNPDELIDWADVVFCSGSKMEFSAIVRNKPLINYGAGLLYGKNCAYEITGPELAEAVISKALKGDDDAAHVENFLSFIGYLHNEYLYNFVNNENKVVEAMLNIDKR